MRNLLLHIFLFTLLTTISFSQPPLRCYSCLTPKDGADFEQLCSTDHFCEGTWCTKGPDERSSGVLHGCSNVVPLDKAASACKDVQQPGYNYSNCYCNNIDFCNSSNLPKFPIVAIILLCLFNN